MKTTTPRRASARLRNGVSLWLALAVLACGPGGDAPGEPAAGPEAREAAGDWFVDRAAAYGLDFRHRNGMTGEYYFHEMMGAGAALLDYDGDGDLDAFLVQSGPIDGAPGEERDQLWRNDLELAPDGTANLRFTQVTAPSGIDGRDYGMGVAAADYDGDGDVDLYVTSFEANRLWRNEGDGTFVDATEAAGVGDDRWSVPALFFDYDRDGDQDLYVGNYVEAGLANHKRCTTDLGEPNYCGPLSFKPLTDALFENLGDGTFREVSGTSGVGGAPGGTLGAAAADLDGDGWLDLYVANDGMPNHQWMNRGDGTFENRALLAGSAVNLDGAAEASMGVDVADFDGDGDEDLFLTHLARETNTLYVNQGDGTFDDRSAPTGLGLPSWEKTAFGTAWFDYDNDGHLDLLTVNGAVRVIDALARAGDPFPLHQPNQLFRNLGDGRFEEVSDRAGVALTLSEVSRGAAFGDVDNDGDIDVLITNNHGPARLLINQVGQDRGWLGLRLTDSSGKVDQLGARVQLSGPGLVRPLWRRVRVAASYGSSQDPRLLFGLGDDAAPGATYSARVEWPDGQVEIFDDLPARQYSQREQGTGKPAGEDG